VILNKEMDIEALMLLWDMLISVKKTAAETSGRFKPN
jgi:hypothetical protein